MPVAIGDNLASPDLTKSKEAGQTGKNWVVLNQAPASIPAKAGREPELFLATVMQSLILPSAPTAPNVLADSCHFRRPNC